MNQTLEEIKRECLSPTCTNPLDLIRHLLIPRAEKENLAQAEQNKALMVRIAELEAHTKQLAKIAGLQACSDCKGEGGPVDLTAYAAREKCQRAVIAEARITAVRTELEGAPCSRQCQANYRYCLGCGGIMTLDSSSPTGYECRTGEKCTGEIRFKHKQCDCWKSRALAVLDGEPKPVTDIDALAGMFGPDEDVDEFIAACKGKVAPATEEKTEP